MVTRNSSRGRGCWRFNAPDRSDTDRANATLAPIGSARSSHKHSKMSTGTAPDARATIKFTAAGMPLPLLAVAGALALSVVDVLIISVGGSA